MFTNRQIAQLVWPLIVEQLLNILVGMVDVIMVASLGEAAVSGVALVDSLNQLVIAFLAAMTTGGAVVCSQFLGMRNEEKAARSAGQLFLLTVTGTAVITSVFLLSGSRLLWLIFGQVEQGVMDNAYIYYMITSCSFPFLALYNSSAALFRANGNSRISMKTSILMNAMNVAGNALCIFVLKMGVAGVAVPTLISRMTASLILFGLLQQPDNPIRITGLGDLVPNGGIIRRILGIGIPGGVESSLFQLGKLMLQSLVATLGTASIAGFAVASNLVPFLYLPGNALGLGLTTVVGRCIGAGEAAQAKMYNRKFLAINYALLAVLSAGLLLGRYRFIGFYNLSPQASEIAADLVFSHCLAMVLWPPAFLAPNTLRASGDVKFTMLTSVSCMWIFRVALAYLFVRGFGLSIQFIWYAMYIDWIFRFGIYRWRFRDFTRRASALHL